MESDTGLPEIVEKKVYCVYHVCRQALKQLTFVHFGDWDLESRSTVMNDVLSHARWLGRGVSASEATLTGSMSGKQSDARALLFSHFIRLRQSTSQLSL